MLCGIHALIDLKCSDYYALSMCQLNCTENQTVGLNTTCELGHSGSVKLIKTFAYSVIMIISLFGNLAVIFIVLRNKRMWTTTNYLIVNMAASDLLISVFAVQYVCLKPAYLGK